MKRFAIFGASGYGREVLPLVRQQLQADLAAGRADLVFVDDQPPAPVVNGQRVLTYAQWLAEPASSRHINIAIANSQVRQKLDVRILWRTLYKVLVRDGISAVGEATMSKLEGIHEIK